MSALNRPSAEMLNAGSDSLPQPLGVAAAGIGPKLAFDDHVHPKPSTGMVLSPFIADGQSAIFGPLEGATNTNASNYLVTVGAILQEPNWSYTIIEQDGAFYVEFPEILESGIRISVRVAVITE